MRTRPALGALLLGLTGLGLMGASLLLAGRGEPAAWPGPGAAAAPLRVAGPLSDRPLAYRIEARLWPERREVSGRMSLRLRNRSPIELRQACLHLYLNAFARPGTEFLRDGQEDRFDPGAPGSSEVSALRQDGQAVPSRAILDGTVLQLDLPRTVSPGGELRLEHDFRSRLPALVARSGHAHGLFMVAQWYPKPGVLRPDGSWHCPPYYPRAEFFADFATYDVRLQVPADQVVGASGVLVSERPLPGLRELQFRAVDVHDFAFAAWPSFQRRRASFEGVEIDLLAPPGRGHQQRTLALLRGALQSLQRWLGPYPYRRLTAIDMPGGALRAAAMEYPTLITFWKPWFLPSFVHLGDEIVVHELIHQYFHGMVASNEVEEPWLDEAVASYVTSLVMEELLGPDGSYLDLGPLRLSLRQKEQLRIAGPSAETLPVGWPARRFRSAWAYGRTVYARGSLLLHTVESLLGRPRLRAALAGYARAFAFRHPGSADLEAALIAAAPPAQRALIGDLLDGVLRSALDLDYSLSCGKDRIEVRRRGALALPLEVRVWTDTGEQRLALDGRAALEVRRVPGLRAAQLGPAGRLVLDHSAADHACQPGGLPGAAALSLAAVLLPVLQVLGP